MLSEIFEENLNQYYSYENSQSVIYLNNDIQDFSYNNLNDESFNYAQSNEVENQSFLDVKGDDIMNQIQEKTTAFKTSYKNIMKYYKAPVKLLENVEIDEGILPKLFSFNDIEEKILKNDDYKNKFSSDVDNLFFKDEIFELQFLNKKRLREENEDNYLNEFIGNGKVSNKPKKSQNKRGRKSENNKGSKEHDRNSADNIIKKIKSEFFKYLILFINNTIKTLNLIYNHKIYKIDYDLINRLNREIDLKYLNMKIKDLLSLNVSPKYKKLKPESNKIYIEKILNEKSLDESIKFAFNMSFRDFIDIFSYKKRVKDLLNEYKINDENISDKIEKNLVGVYDLLNRIAKNDNNDRYYFSNFVFYLYNYEKWFLMKRGRTKKNIIIDI